MNKKSVLFIFGSLLFSTYYYFLTLSVAKDTFRDIDYEIMLEIQKMIHIKFDIPFSYITLLGSSEFIIFWLIILFFAVFLYYKKYFYSLIFILLIYLFEIAGKIFIFHPKPPSTLTRNILDLALPSSSIINPQNAFPSGHTARTTFLLIIIFFLITNSNLVKTQKIIFYSTIGLVFILIIISRISLGEHWYSDVLGGVTLGLISSFLALAFYPPSHKNRRYKPSGAL